MDNRDNKDNSDNEEITIERYENDKIAFNYPSNWYEFENKAKNPTEVVAMKTDKGKGGTFSFSVANAGGKSTEYWRDFMEKFLKDNGAIISDSEIKVMGDVVIFDFRSEISKSDVSSNQRHIGFVRDGAFFYSFFTSLDLDALEEDIDIMLGFDK
ncbi:hypothetical protein KQY27_04510 [Methanobrevibacter sp. TMH8]|uniref:avidin/streptavidin family protein n=1 Tax=Methanobrevibacter sp. TMH8 TaxID=2848611 RepID=UPI001CCF2BF1|nr:avidin/streptavidin family protein [Methanobrevibacter sp. TMH8]MBZ9570809.1 hypothetical protein [Methanobrevibacter sp. TMH8]